jgi:DNA-binding response OmpR family regulator
MTASDKVEDEIKGLMLGAEDYIRKPINKNTLLLRVKKVLDNSAERIDQISIIYSAFKSQKEKETTNITLNCKHDNEDENVIVQ